MATKYFRITAYDPMGDYSFIMDSNGMFEKLWQFSAHLVNKGYKILEISTDEQFKDLNITKADYYPDKMLLRAAHKGKPQYEDRYVHGNIQHVVSVGCKSYVPKAQ